MKLFGWIAMISITIILRYNLWKIRIAIWNGSGAQMAVIVAVISNAARSMMGIAVNTLITRRVIAGRIAVDGNTAKSMIGKLMKPLITGTMVAGGMAGIFD